MKATKSSPCPIIGTPKPSCFAHRGGDCLALSYARCSGCRFYKTHAQNEAGQARCNEIIAAKPIEEQRYLADRYYQRKMPWKEGKAHDR